MTDLSLRGGSPLQNLILNKKNIQNYPLLK